MNTSVTFPFQSRFVRHAGTKTNPIITPKMINALAATGILTALGGCGIVFAAWDGATIGIVVASIGTLITAITTGIIAVMNAKTKNKIEEMKALQEAQKDLSAANRHTLTNIHTAIAQNTAETIKSAVAADQVKERVEQLEQKLPVITPQPDTKKIE